MLRLRTDTPPQWIEVVLSNFDAFLIEVRRLLETTQRDATKITPHAR